MINVALFGFGRIGQMHAENLTKNKEIKLLYVHEKIDQLSKKAKNIYGCKIEKNDMSVLTNIQNMINLANELGLKINAGHDLNLDNLKYLVDMGNINEVSIGHAIIVDSLNFGFETTIKKYLDIIRN